MKTFKETNVIYLVFTGKEADEEVYELNVLDCIYDDDSEKAALATDVGRILIEKKELCKTEIHVDTTGFHMFTDKVSAQNWQKESTKQK